MRLNARTFWVALVAIAVLAFTGPTIAQSSDPIVGSWKLDAAKSTYKPGPAPKAVTVDVTAAGKGIKVSVDSVSADGTPLKWGFTTQRDGKDVPVTGHPVYETAATTQASPTAGTTEYKKAGKVVATTKLTISADGKVMTLLSTGTDPKGQAMNNVVVLTKQ